MSRRSKWNYEHLGYAAERPSYSEPVLEGRRNYSNYFATFNTNKTPIEVDPKEFAKKLEEYLSEETIKPALYYVDQDGERTDEDNYEKISDVKLKSVVEVGGTMNTVHSHVMLAFTHYTRLRLDYQKLRKILNKKFQRDGIVLVYTFWKLYRDASQNFEAYISKTRFSGKKTEEQRERGPSLSGKKKREPQQSEPRGLTRQETTDFL